ncbi:E3 ubiquitin-protein ligase rnf168 [Rhipicephalus sanguineus]|uniref:E3 ubiquitin-protein ligase rnf168 n=1 Tax=Rhipicephalus sanguineus TaxID=34632 RepID=UPI001894997F|nr:E3 ubiquitin-protein ligase rnf168 [Rhipicephalus sanguineus]
MAPRRKRLLSSSPDSGKGSSSNESSLTESDVTCPVCLSMVVEPVTMPCAHEVCKSCFTSTVLMANKECPMCRMRIASWARRAAREGTLVNRARWELIKTRFPRQVARRLSGEDSRAGTPQRIVLRPLCMPGEIRREYEEQRQRAEAEWRRERELEAQEGEALAQRLASEEERALEEQRRQMRRDQRLACLWGVFGDTPSVLAAVPLVRSLLMPENDDDNDSASSFMPPEDRPQSATRNAPPPATPLRGGENRLQSRSVQTALLEVQQQETQTSEHGEDAAASYLEDLQLARRIQRQLNRESRRMPSRVYNLRPRAVD